VDESTVVCHTMTRLHANYYELYDLRGPEIERAKRDISNAFGALVDWCNQHGVALDEGNLPAQAHLT
jgi:hypothetical protein